MPSGRQYMVSRLAPMTVPSEVIWQARMASSARHVGAAQAG